MTIHLLGLRKDYFVQKVFVFKLLCLESFLLRNYLVHLLFSSFPSQLQLQNNRGLLKRKEEGNLNVKLSKEDNLSDLFHKN